MYKGNVQRGMERNVRTENYPNKKKRENMIIIICFSGRINKLETKMKMDG